MWPKCMLEAGPTPCLHGHDTSVHGHDTSVLTHIRRVAELPRDVRDALVSWNHATDYELPAYSVYAGGSRLFEKTYDLGAPSKDQSHRNVSLTLTHPYHTIA